MRWILLCLLLYPLITFSQTNNRVYRYNKKHFSDHNIFYKLTSNAGGVAGTNSYISIVKPVRAFWGSLKEDGSLIIIKQDSREKAVKGAITWTEVDKIDIPHLNLPSINYAGQLYFPETLSSIVSIDSALLVKDKKEYRRAKRIRYDDYKFVLQALSVPIKFRRGVNGFPYQTESSFNLGLGAGLKYNLNWYMANKSFLGLKTNSVSFTPGLISGLGTTDIKMNVTAGPSFKDRKEPIFSYGGFFMIGLNSINIGFVWGKDVALKDGGKAGGWVYNHKSWTGIVVALDVIK